MTANLNPVFTKTPKIGIAQISTINTAKDGTGTLGTVITGGENGTRISRITIEAITVTTAGMVRLFIDTGTTITLWKEIPVSAITPSATVLAYNYIFELLGERALILPYNFILKAGTEKGETFNIIAEGGDI
jgi:hypothetical protein